MINYTINGFTRVSNAAMPPVGLQGYAMQPSPSGFTRVCNAAIPPVGLQVGRQSVSSLRCKLESKQQ